MVVLFMVVTVMPPMAEAMATSAMAASVVAAVVLVMLVDSIICFTVPMVRRATSAQMFLPRYMMGIETDTTWSVSTHKMLM